MHVIVNLTGSSCEHNEFCTHIIHKICKTKLAFVGLCVVEIKSQGGAFRTTTGEVILLCLFFYRMGH